MDGTVPNKNSIRYTDPIELDKTTVVKARSFKSGWLPSYVVSLPFQKAKSLQNISESRLRKGLHYKYFEGIFRSVYDFEKKEPVKSGKDLSDAVHTISDYIDFHFNNLQM